MIQKTTIKITGIAPLLQHNGQLANPLNPLAKKMKEVTSIRKKTDEHHLQLQELEFLAGLYLDEKRRVIIPSEVIESCLVEGAKKAKLGKAFKAAVSVMEDSLLDYNGPKTPEALWQQAETFADVRGVRVGGSRIMRTRPIFRQWSLAFTVTWDDEQINQEQLRKAVEDAGAMVGLCDYRPKFGRFSLESMEGEK
jgi:hypothetical protein